MKRIQNPRHHKTTTLEHRGKQFTLVVTGTSPRAEAIRILVKHADDKEMPKEREQLLINAIDMFRLTTPSYHPGTEIGFDNTISQLLGKYADECHSDAVKAAARTALAKRRT